MEYEPIWALFFKLLSLYLKARIRMRIKGKGWIRIRVPIKVASRIRIQIRILVTSRIQIRIRINLQMTSQNVLNMSLFEHFSSFWAFIWKLGSESASKWQAGSRSGSASKWQAGSQSGSAWKWQAGSGSASGSASKCMMRIRNTGLEIGEWGHIAMLADRQWEVEPILTKTRNVFCFIVIIP